MRGLGIGRMAHEEYSYFQPPARILMGPGPSMVDPRVQLAMGAAPVGYLDPAAFEVLDDIGSLLRYTFETDNEFTLAATGTGSAGMEAAVMNFVEPGTKVGVLANGFFSERLTDMCRRRRAEIVRLEKPWGEVFGGDEVADFIEREKPEVVTFVQAETSTGAFQPSKAICSAAHAAGALVIGDCVTSLGGMPVEVDRNGIDIAFSATQKCLGAPAGLAPITLSPQAVERLDASGNQSIGWYFDLRLLFGYWHEPRTYHHTAPISLLYALREALRIIHEETLEVRHARHKLNHLALVAGLEAMDLGMHVAPKDRLWSLNAVRLPNGIDDDALRKDLLGDYGIEVLGGFGPLAGQILRVGLMGASSTRNNVLLFLDALETCLARQDYVAIGQGARAAEQVYARQGEADGR